MADDVITLIKAGRRRMEEAFARLATGKDDQRSAVAEQDIPGTILGELPSTAAVPQGRSARRRPA
jgi:hypothetical protein